METSTTSPKTENRFPDPRLRLLEPNDNLPGIEMRQADFASRGEGKTPFKGGRFTIAPGATSRLDVHDVRECWMVVAGEGELSYDERRFRVGPGDFCYFEPQRTHRIHNDGDETLVIYTVWW